MIFPELNQKQLCNLIQIHLSSSAEVKQKTALVCEDTIFHAALIIAGTFHKGGKLLLCGNGGSAADCQHMATEFVSRLTKDFERPGLPAIALTTDTSFLTAFSNDCGYDDIFVRQVVTIGRNGDVLLGISTSGTSPNVVQAIESAKKIGMKTILLTGENPEIISDADITIRIPSLNTQYIQEAHLVVEHIICEIVEYILFKSDKE